jgi:hypothetical protein
LLIGGGHTIVTASYQGWSGLKNGALLNAAEQAGFDLLITADQEMRYQQNLTRRKLALIVLSTNNWSFIQASIGAVMAAVEAAAAPATSPWKTSVMMERWHSYPST